MKRSVLIVLFLGLLVMNACKAPQSFEYRGMSHLELKHLGLTKTVVTMDLSYYNPNSFGVNLKNVDCSVYFNQNYLGRYLLDTFMHIGGKSDFIVPANISFDMMDIIKKGASFIMNKEALITVKGTTRVGKSGFYKTIPIQFETKYKLPF